MITLTNQQARRFMLLKHGLLGEYKFAGKFGAFDFISQTGCIQFDPVDLCGKNAEITLQSRVKGFTKTMLSDLLYKDRLLFDYPDKQLSIIPTKYWPYFERFREAARARLKEHPEVEEHIDDIYEYIKKSGAVNSDDLKLEGDTSWFSAINWSAGSNLSRSVLEQMYSSGDLIVHHKKGTRRYYDIAERHISSDIINAPDPLPDDFDHLKWRVLRRIGAIGILWNRGSDAWLGIWGLTTENRNKVFEALINDGEITEVIIEGINTKFYIQTGDIPVINEVKQDINIKPRCEFIAPLDPFMWDRKLIKSLFDYHYSWEIYTPPNNRKYGAYVLPILNGDQFIGRIEMINKRDAKTLIIKNIWYEDSVKKTKKLDAAINACIKRFVSFNDCITMQTGDADSNVIR